MRIEHLNSLDQIQTIDQASSEKPVLIFKHSTQCSISSVAFNRLERSWKEDEMQDLQVYLLDVIRDRMVSNAVAEKYDVWHQSPQALLIKDGQCIYNDSHFGISYPAIREHLAKDAA